MSHKNKYIGSNFDEFLAECGILEEVTVTATKRVKAWQIDQAKKAQHLIKMDRARGEDVNQPGGVELSARYPG